MKSLPLIFSAKVVEAIDEGFEKCNDKRLKFELLKIRDSIIKSMEIAKPLISENENENLWLLTTATTEFQPIEKGHIISGLSSIKPETLRWLLLITTD